MLFLFIYLILLPVLWFGPKQRHLLIVVLLVFYAVYDLLDYSTLYYGVSSSVKLFPETLLAGFIILYFLQHMWVSKYYNVHNLFLFVVTIFFTLVAVSLHNIPLIAELHELRFIFRPILFFILIVETCTFSRQQFNVIFGAFLLIATITCLAGIYQHYTFEGDFRAVWRYEPLLRAKLAKNDDFFVHLMSNQILRDGKLRASGPFYSALDFGFLAGIFTTVCYIFFRNVKNTLSHIISISGVSIGFLACYASCVRTSFLIVVFGICYDRIIFSSLVVSRRNHIVLLVCAACCLFLLLGVFEFYMDSSALGRLKQVYLVISSLTLTGHGFSTRHFDSAFLFYINAMGLLSISLILYTFRIILPPMEGFDYNTAGKALYICGLAILFIMFIQFTVGGYVYNCIPILMACFLTTLKDENSGSIITANYSRNLI